MTGTPTAAMAGTAADRRSSDPQQRRCAIYAVATVTTLHIWRIWLNVILGEGSRLALALNVGLHKHVLAIKDGIGKLPYPVAEYHEAGLAREHQVELDVAVAEHEVVYILVGGEVVLGIAHEILAVFTHIRGLVAVGSLESAVLGPVEPEPHAPARMHHIEQPLAQRAVENASQEAVFGVWVAQTVAMGHVEDAVVNLGGHGRLVDLDATLLLEVAVGPEVVVAGKKVYLYAAVGEFGELAEKSGVALGHHVAVLVPEIKHIAQEIDGGSLVLDAVKKPHQPALVHPGVGDGERAQVGIREEIDVLHNHSVLIEAELYPRLLAHHALVPSGVEDQIDIGGLDLVEALDLGAHVFEDEVGGGARGGGEGHVEVYGVVVLDVYLVYHTEVPDVYGYLGVVHGLEHLHDALLYLGFLFLCHSCELIDTTKLVEKAQRTKLFSLFFRQRRQRAGST